MNITVKANPILDTLMQYVEDIQERHIKIPRGAFIGNNSEYRAIYDRANRAERAFTLASDLLSIPESALYAACLVARRWYYTHQWQKSLPEEDAQRLLSCMIEQNRKDAQYSRAGGNDYLLFLNKVISDWARKSREKQKTA